jgi:hypothetical protein
MVYDVSDVWTENPLSFWDDLDNFVITDFSSAEAFDAVPPVLDPAHPRASPSDFSRFSSRLPRLDDADDDTSDIEDATGTSTTTWVLKEAKHQMLCGDIQSRLSNLTLGYSMPSRNSWTQYLQEYATNVQEMLPFIHIVTFSIDQAPAELLLAMAALGAMYKYERSKSLELYWMAKANLLENIQRDDSRATLLSLAPGGYIKTPRRNLQQVQTFILLFLYASWAEKRISFEALSMSSQLAMLIRESGITTSEKMPEPVDWLSWVEIEEKRRTLYAAYVLFNLHTLAFSIPPLVFNYEIGMFLPGNIDQWRARDTKEWHRAPRQDEFLFQQTLRSLYDGSGTPLGTSLSSFSNYVLIHGILQQIYIDRQGLTGTLNSETVERFHTALRTWEVSWRNSHESTLDPACPKGPFGLNAAALLRICYISLVSDLGPCRGLLSRDLDCLDVKRPSPRRSPLVDRAVLHAAHALSIPVRLGIAYMACTNSPIWTIEHSLSGFRCALLLYDWLMMISGIVGSPSSPVGLRQTEVRLIKVITSIIKETDFAATLDTCPEGSSRYRQMAETVLRLWAQAFQGIHLLEVDNALGSAFRSMVDSLSNASLE